MSLIEHVARKLYEHDRGMGWDDAPDIVRDVFTVTAETALSATAGWLELAAATRVLGGARGALQGVAGLIRRTLGEDPADPVPVREEPEFESPAKRELREVLEGYGA